VAKRKGNKSPSEAMNNAGDTEFGSEVTLSKKARKRAARERKKNNK